MNPPITPRPERISAPPTPAPQKSLPMPDEATVKALEEYFAKLAAVRPGDEPEWSVEDLFPSESSR